VHGLQPHPLSVRLYGAPKVDEDLMDSIEREGIHHTIVVDEDGHILSGNRRWRAYAELHAKHPTRFSKHICVRIFYGSELEKERLVIDGNKQRVKTKGQVAREAAALLRIEKALAAEREKAGKRHPSAEVRKGRASRLVGEELGISEHTVERAAEVVTAAESGNKEAVAALEMLDRNEASFTAAFKRIEKPRKDEKAVAAQEQEAQALTATLKAQGLDAVVQRSKLPGQFHVTVRGLAAEQVMSLAVQMGQGKAA
jgi:ParB-like chromosome segregation protein Spo0J